MDGMAAVAERFDLAYPAYTRKIATFSRIHAREVPGFDKSDLETELQEILWLVCEIYDPNKGATFNTLFWQSANNRLKDLKKSANRQKRAANLYTESLDVSAVRYAVEQMIQNPSAEDEILARVTVSERFNSRNRNL